MDEMMDVRFLTSVIGRCVASAEARSMEKMGGLSGAFEIVDVELEDGESLALVVKRTSTGSEAVAASLGTPREGKFFASLAQELGDVVPRAYHATGDAATGAKRVLMEFLPDAVPAGVMFGRGNPNNWALSEEKMSEIVARGGSPTAIDVSAEAFALYAKLHARYWGDEAVLENEWLRGAKWVRGGGEDEWATAQRIAADAWAEVSKVDWPNHLVACLDASFTKVNWDAFQKELRARPWTVVHGDAHPHNILRVNHSTDAARLVLIDFEMVGVGSNAQELGQFLISHMSPAERRAHERDLVRKYHEDLVCALRGYGRGAAADEYSFDACWNEYVAGGAGRWLWFVPYLAKACPPDMARFFNHQLATFLEDHFPNPATVPMPRV